MHWSELFLGNELYEKAERKLRDGIASCNKKLNILHLEDERVSKQFKSISDVLSLIDSKNYVKEVVNPLKDNMLFLKEETDKIINSIAEIEQQIKMMQTWRDKFSKMKNGSVALIKQITTISKIRIINPIKDTDALSGLRISVKYLNSIDNKLKEFYIYK
ncbi:hypothetical protein [Pectinatus frisingensis]|uniref:hypothetical protein n=1 Tax=Pectinatus frisingensis TaxID=865 RepID=UPI0018C61F9F|nr:hypothetical protein [Pectinatus frisingensis]